MFEKFTEPALKVMMLAQEESRRLGHNFVGSESILLGLIGENNGISAQVLKAMGVKLEDARLQVELILGRGFGYVALEVPFTQNGKRVLELACKAAFQLDNEYIGTEHLLLGLINVQNAVGVQVLERLGINLSQLHDAVMENLSITSLSTNNIDSTANTNLTVVVASSTIFEYIDNVNVALRDAQKQIYKIENYLKQRVPIAGKDVTKIIDSLPDTSRENQPGIKELLTQLQAEILTDNVLNSEDKSEALEQVLVLAAAAQNPTVARMQKFVKTAIKILKGTITDLPKDNQLGLVFNQVLPAIYQVFNLS